VCAPRMAELKVSLTKVFWDLSGSALDEGDEASRLVRFDEASLWMAVNHLLKTFGNRSKVMRRIFKALCYAPVARLPGIASRDPSFCNALNEREDVFIFNSCNHIRTLLTRAHPLMLNLHWAISDTQKDGKEMGEPRFHQLHNFLQIGITIGQLIKQWHNRQSHKKGTTQRRDEHHSLPWAAAGNRLNKVINVGDAPIHVEKVLPSYADVAV
ncbi:hypothetical protein Tco_1381572, partial [Tanacetum coccineum]